MREKIKREKSVQKTYMNCTLLTRKGISNEKEGNVIHGHIKDVLHHKK